MNIVYFIAIFLCTMSNIYSAVTKLPERHQFTIQGSVIVFTDSSTVPQPLPSLLGNGQNQKREEVDQQVVSASIVLLKQAQVMITRSVSSLREEVQKILDDRFKDLKERNKELLIQLEELGSVNKI
jgi:hypothetical protein